MALRNLACSFDAVEYACKDIKALKNCSLYLYFFRNYDSYVVLFLAR